MKIGPEMRQTRGSSMKQKSRGSAAALQFTTASSALHLNQAFDVLPIYEVVEPCLEVLGTSVAVVNVVAVLPHIAAENRLAAVHQRIFAVGRLRHLELAVVDGEPSPTRAELGDAGVDEVRPHLVEAAVVLHQLLELARQLVAAAALLHPVPEVRVIIVLASVVDQPLVLLRIGLLDDLLQAL